MSYIVEIIKPIKKENVIGVVEMDDSLAVNDEGADWLEVKWTGENETAIFSYSQSRIEITTPTEKAYEKTQEIASLLNADVIGEEERSDKTRTVNPGIIEGRSTWLGWPILVTILIILLLWRW